MHLRLFRGALDQKDGRENEKSAGDRREPNVSKEVAQQHEHRDQAKAKPPRQAAQPFPDTHGFVSGR
jgi:hypothetical protein